MVHKIKASILLASALLAISALTASGVGAATFTAEQGTTITGAQEGQFVISATDLTMSCEITAFHGTAPAASFQELALATVLTKCRTNLGTEVTVTGLGHNGEKSFCHLVIRASNNGDLVCPAGVEVTADAATCVIHMPAQSVVETFTFTNTKFEGKSAITLDVNIHNLQGTHTDGFLCPFNGGGKFTNTKVEGVGLVVGENQFGQPVDISWDQ